MKIVGIVQARMGSTRFPGKVLKPLAGIPILTHMMQRLARSRRLNQVIIATSTDSGDDVLHDFAKRNGYTVGRGSHHDVLDRYFKIAHSNKADVVVRFTGDCPLIDPEIADQVIERHAQSGTNDYTCNIFPRTFPRGFDTEVLSFECLKRLHEGARGSIYREHVTNYIYDYPEKFKIENIKGEKDYSRWRLCVDTPEDYQLASRIFDSLYRSHPAFEYRELYQFLDEHPELHALNASIEQTKILKSNKV